MLVHAQCRHSFYSVVSSLFRPLLLCVTDVGAISAEFDINSGRLSRVEPPYTYSGRWCKETIMVCLMGTAVKKL